MRNPKTSFSNLYMYVQIFARFTLTETYLLISWNFSVMGDYLMLCRVKFRDNRSNSFRDILNSSAQCKCVVAPTKNKPENSNHHRIWLSESELENICSRNSDLGDRFRAVGKTRGSVFITFLFINCYE